MKIWHQLIIPQLDTEKLLRLHRDICMIRGYDGKGKYKDIDYIFKYRYAHLVAYHKVVLQELKKRKILYDSYWDEPTYCGKRFGFIKNKATDEEVDRILKKPIIYEEHNQEYYDKCLKELNKGVGL